MKVKMKRRRVGGGMKTADGTPVGSVKPGDIVVVSEGKGRTMVKRGIAEEVNDGTNKSGAASAPAADRTPAD